jgi:hypothetical protein
MYRTTVHVMHEQRTLSSATDPVSAYPQSTLGYINPSPLPLRTSVPQTPSSNSQNSRNPAHSWGGGLRIPWTWCIWLPGIRNPAQAIHVWLIVHSRWKYLLLVLDESHHKIYKTQIDRSSSYQSLLKSYLRTTALYKHLSPPLPTFFYTHRFPRKFKNWEANG